MQERAVFHTPERAISAARKRASTVDMPMYTEARPVHTRRQLLGYEAWYRDANDIMQPVYENEV